MSLLCFFTSSYSFAFSLFSPFHFSFQTYIHSSIVCALRMLEQEWNRRKYFTIYAIVFFYTQLKELLACSLQQHRHHHDCHLRMKILQPTYTFTNSFSLLVYFCFYTYIPHYAAIIIPFSVQRIIFSKCERG